MLAFLDNSGLKLYQYTGWRFVLVTLVPLVPSGDTRLSSFTHDGFSHLSESLYRCQADGCSPTTRCMASWLCS